MNNLLNLQELGDRLRKVDRHLVSLLSKRTVLTLQVEKWKRAHNQPIIRLDVEDKRLEEIRKWATDAKLNPNFATSILYLIIRESCSVQIEELQNPEQEIEATTEEEWYQQLKENLSALTAKIAPKYDKIYEHPNFYATRMYLDFEKQVLHDELESLNAHTLATDIGCATGKMSFHLSKYFNKVIGFDISPHMIRMAKGMAVAQRINNATFQIADIEEKGIELEDNTVDLFIMNLGTASDIRDIKKLFTETERVMVPGGKFIFSFYNAEALLYQCFAPWPVGLNAEINLVKHCLDVHCEGEIYSIYAHPYSIRELKELFPENLEITSILTYPTVGSIFPNELFEEEAIRKLFENIDHQLSKGALGAYILCVGVVSK